MNHYDEIIIGGGCSGLSLAIQTAKREPKKRLLILEDRTVYKDDRTWSFWDVETHPFEDQILKTWDQWQIQYQGRPLKFSSERYRYCSIRSDSFYKAALQQIDFLPNVTLLMDRHVFNLVETASNVIIETNKGCYTCGKAFDSRPEKMQTVLYQHFLGWHVLSENPIFDPQTVVLMDFDVDQSKGLHFMYLLPFSYHEALIESTFISPYVHDEPIYEEAILAYLKARFQDTGYQIVRKERGILALSTTVPGRKSPRVIPIGAKAGWTRASTGYAFLPIQKAIQELVFDQAKSKFFNTDLYLDHIFLAFLHKHPELAPELFFNLFGKNSPERLIRFLTGRWTLFDLLQILFSMPKIAMMRQALQLIRIKKWNFR